MGVFQFIDITGQRFGRLVAVRYAGPSRRGGGGGATWQCICDCGYVRVACSAGLRAGNIKSCGCQRKRKRTKEQKLEQKREQRRRWRAANPEKAREHTRRWRAANPEKAREYKRRQLKRRNERIANQTAFLAELRKRGLLDGITF
jgi:hypothetical protein